MNWFSNLANETERFWDRVQEAFGNLKAPEIARRLSIEKQAVYKWRKGSLPGLDTLLAISKSTGRSLHWLVTGEGPKTVYIKDEGALFERDDREPVSDDYAALPAEMKAYIRKQIVEVLGGILINTQDRAVAELMIANLRARMEEGHKQ